MKGDCTETNGDSFQGRVGDHPQMKGDCTSKHEHHGDGNVGDHPQMKGDCTYCSVGACGDGLEITPR